MTNPQRVRLRGNFAKIDDVSQALTFTYATWNPSDKDAAITLSNGNLTATNANAVWKSVRATQGKSSGKWYWEIKCDAGGAGVLNMYGIAKSTASLATFIGGDANGRGYYGATGEKYTNGTGAAYGATYVTNDIIGIALDMDGGTLKFYKNNVAQNSGTAAYTGLSGTIYPGCSENGNGIGTANFGATTMTYTAPSGYSQGVFTVV